MRQQKVGIGLLTAQAVAQHVGENPGRGMRRCRVQGRDAQRFPHESAQAFGLPVPIEQRRHRTIVVKPIPGRLQRAHEARRRELFAKAESLGAQESEREIEWRR